MHRNAGSHGDDYHAPTWVTKMDMPRFTQEDVVGWVSKCKSYFNLDKTPIEHKVYIAHLVLDEQEYQWFDGFRKGMDRPIN